MYLFPENVSAGVGRAGGVVSSGLALSMRVKAVTKIQGVRSIKYLLQCRTPVEKQGTRKASLIFTGI